MVHCIRVAGFSFHFTDDEEGVNWVDGELVIRQSGRIHEDINDGGYYCFFAERVLGLVDQYAAV